MTEARDAAPDDGLALDGGRTVREQVHDALGGVETTHAIAATKRIDSTIYLVAVYETTMSHVPTAPDNDVPVVYARTVVVDLDDETVSATDNGLWLPAERGAVENVMRSFARTVSGISGAVDDDVPPGLNSTSDVDVDLLLSKTISDRSGQRVDRMRNDPGIDPTRSWGYGGGPPPEIATLVERLTEVGLDPSEHVTRLEWGKKEPLDRVPRPVDELLGNYGVELLPRDAGLVAIDVDYPDEFPDVELPETLEITSPHGSDERRHVILWCDDKRAIQEELGAWAIQAVDWGDLWIGDRYLVGPGSQLSEFGCDDGDHERGEPGGCSRCRDPERGFYRIANDAPIATVEPDEILSLLDESSGFTPRERAPEAPRVDDGRDDDVEPVDADDDGDGIRCDKCDRIRPEDELKRLEIGPAVRHICRGGCEGA